MILINLLSANHLLVVFKVFAASNQEPADPADSSDEEAHKHGPVAVLGYLTDVLDFGWLIHGLVDGNVFNNKVV